METQKLDYVFKLSDFKPFIGPSEYSRRNWNSEIGGYAPYSKEVNLRGNILAVYHMVPIICPVLIGYLLWKAGKKTLEALTKKR